jgi:hypothetical protein
MTEIIDHEKLLTFILQARPEKFGRDGIGLRARRFCLRHARGRMGPKYFRRNQAAEYVRNHWGIPCAPSWLAKLACVSTKGPPFYKAGRTVLYDPADLDEWARGRIGAKRQSTSALDAPRQRLQRRAPFPKTM